MRERLDEWSGLGVVALGLDSPPSSLRHGAAAILQACGCDAEHAVAPQVPRLRAEGDEAGDSFREYGPVCRVSGETFDPTGALADDSRLTPNRVVLDLERFGSAPPLRIPS